MSFRVYREFLKWFGHVELVSKERVSEKLLALDVESKGLGQFLLEKKKTTGGTS